MPFARLFLVEAENEEEGRGVVKELEKKKSNFRESNNKLPQRGNEPTRLDFQVNAPFSDLSAHVGSCGGGDFTGTCRTTATFTRKETLDLE